MIQTRRLLYRWKSPETITRNHHYIKVINQIGPLDLPSRSLFRLERQPKRSTWPDVGHETPVHLNDRHEVPDLPGDRPEVSVRLYDRPKTLMDTNPSQRPVEGTDPSRRKTLDIKRPEDVIRFRNFNDESVSTINLGLNDVYTYLYPNRGSDPFRFRLEVPDYSSREAWLKPIPVYRDKCL